jgi:N-acetylmuramoyl-L-alanine amidase
MLRPRLWLSLAALLCSILASAQVVCIDPGHPSENGLGTKGKRITEVRAAWLVALELQKLLERDGFTVILTKKSELEKKTNRERAEVANAAKADLMVRLHCDAASGSGFSVHYPSQAGKVRAKTGPSAAVIQASGRLAKPFHSAMRKSLSGTLRDRGLRTDLQTMIGKRQGALTGSIYSEVPVVLVEMCKLQEAKDDLFMASPEGRKKMAEALHAGVRAALR